MNTELKLSEDEWGRRKLSAALVFEEPVHLLSLAWMGCEMWWAKSAQASARHDWSVQYHHLCGGSSQVIVTCGGSVIDGCVIPLGLDPASSVLVDVALARPSVLYRNEGHGVALVAVPQAATASLRNGIWRVKPSCMTDPLRPFDAALMRTRRGHDLGFEAGTAFQPAASGG
jgi:hypothetical protein